MWLAVWLVAAAQDCGNCGTEAGSASSQAAQASQPMTNVFGNSRYLQAISEQVKLSRQGGPLPFTLSGKVPAWTSGPPQEDLYTQSAQLTYKLSDQWTLLGQQHPFEPSYAVVTYLPENSNYIAGNYSVRGWRPGVWRQFQRGF